MKQRITTTPLKNIRLHILFNLLISLFIGVMSPSPVSADTKPLKFAFFNTATPEDYWWNNASKVMQAACEDFGIELDIYYADRNQFLMVRQFQQVANRSPRVNGAIFANMKQNIVQMLKIAEKANIPVFVFNAGLTETERKMYGGPRLTFSRWTGQIVPNDEQAGYDLAKKLFAQAKKNGLTDSNGKIQVIGISGTRSDIAAMEREKGLMKAVKDDSKVILHQIVPAFWERERGQAVFLGLKSRYPKLNVVWAANDPMGLGAIDGIKKLNLVPGKDILVGSIDWIPDALDAIRKNELCVSVGGHFLESAWSVVLLYDYLSGNDFSGESVEFTSSMGILTFNNINKYSTIFEHGNWEEIDFKVFSKTSNPRSTAYNFSLDDIVKQLSR